MALLMISAPFILGVLAASVAATLLQTGLVFNLTVLVPDLTRLNPMRGIKRLFGVSGMVEAGKSVLKLAVLGFAAYHVMSGGLVAMAGAAAWLPGQLADRIMRQILQLAMTLLAAQVAIAGADMWWVRHKHGSELRMSKQDVKQESKEADGNPQVKARLRQIRMARSRKRMLAAVPTATVVVTNPTHYAVALTYDRNKGVRLALSPRASTRSPLASERWRRSIGFPWWPIRRWRVPCIKSNWTPKFPRSISRWSLK